MAKRAKAGERANGSQRNARDAKELQNYLNEIHEHTDKMESFNAGQRAKIGRVYEAASEKLGLTKAALKKTWRKQRNIMKEEVWAKNSADAEDRTALEEIGAMLGDTPFGQWASNLAKVIPETATDTSSSD